MAGHLNIVLCLRAPVGGLFRHVCDLAREQAAMGHHLGLICDAAGGDEAVSHAIRELSPVCTLGIERISIARMPGLGDLKAVRQVGAIVRGWQADILHGHGAKGGAYARLAAPGMTKLRRFYTPHGGSLHYSADSLSGRIFLSAERYLLKRTDGIIFESEFSASTFAAKVATPGCPSRVIYNGLCKEDFSPAKPRNDAADFVFVGELRELKGVHILLEALALLRGKGKPFRAACVGDGPDSERFRAQAADLGLDGAVSFPGRLPAREAFTRGRILVVPSLAEAFPYIVLEAAAARMPMIATNVGGIGEIFGDQARRLVPPGDPAALAEAMETALADPGAREEAARALYQRARRNFTVEKMARAVTEFYGETA